jgi:predicted adenylyl cyclase CyaB
MKNIELKAKVENFRTLRELLKKAGATREGILLQEDVYFNCKKGRLKLRTINNKISELIYYKRPDKNGSKLFTYDRCPIPGNQAKTLREILKETCGESISVTKKRELWMHGNTRVHLDVVKELGMFIELETVVNKKAIPQAKVEHEKVARLLQISKLPKVRWSYSDLSRKAKNRNSAGVFFKKGSNIIH